MTGAGVDSTLLRAVAVGKGKTGTVYRIGFFSGKYAVRFDNGSKREDLTADEVERV